MARNVLINLHARILREAFIVRYRIISHTCECVCLFYCKNRGWNVVFVAEKYHRHQNHRCRRLSQKRQPCGVFIILHTDYAIPFFCRSFVCLFVVKAISRRAFIKMLFCDKCFLVTHINVHLAPPSYPSVFTTISSIFVLHL